MAITEVRYLSDRTEMQLAGFAFLGADSASCVHPNYPGMVFQAVKNRTDVASCGAALILFTTSLNVASNYKKLVFGADVGHHLHRTADGSYPNVDKFPTVAGAYLRTHGPSGIVYTSGNSAQVEHYQNTVIGFDGTQWVQGNFGSSTKAVVIGVHSRAPHGFAWHMSAGLNAMLPDLILPAVLKHPRTNFKPARIMQGANGGLDSSHFLGEKVLQLGGNSESEKPQHGYPAVGGELFVTADFACRKFLTDQKETFLADYPSAVRSKVRSAYEKQLASVRETVPLALMVTVSLPTVVGRTSALKLTVGRKKGPRVVASTFERLGPGTTGREEYAAGADAKMSWFVDESGRFPYDGQPYRPLSTSVGWGNAYAPSGETATEFVSGSYTFFKAPNVALTFGPETADTDASTTAAGEVLVNGATLFQQLSPMARPATSQKYRTLNDLIRHECHDVLQPASFTGALPSEDDPWYLTEAVSGGTSVRTNVERDLDLVQVCEPFTREVYSFTARVTSSIL